MPRRHPPEPLSPRALARLRASPRSYVPTELDLAAARPGEGVGADAAVVPPVDDSTGGRHGRVRHPRAWVRLPAAFVGARWQPGRAALVGVVVVVALAVAVFGLRVAWARSADGGTVIAPGGGSRAGPTGVTAGAVPVGVGGTAGVPSGGVTSGGAASTASPGVSSTAGAGVPLAAVVVVHVVGRVRHPGVRQLPAGSRVADAVEAAGGATSKADLSALNLARVLVDGEQVRVPAVGDPPVTSPGTGGGGTGAGGTGAGGATGAKVPLNTADLAALDTLPGVGPVLAQRILDWRTEHGRFTSVDELGEVSGIGEKLLAQLSPLVTL
ncbi:MAG TPA: ComEA family DNA-binding protein [Ornithinibacter sp.]|nr:ComEA family DNA-binding protein [Ornithinibacter sp.]